MFPIRLRGIVTEDRRLIVDLPPDVPPGEVIIEIVYIDDKADEEQPRPDEAPEQ